MTKNYLFTSESVSPGHPDKLCDQLSDTVLDYILADDKKSRVACEVLAKGEIDKPGSIVVAGEITTVNELDFDDKLRKKICDIGYNSNTLGFNGEKCEIIKIINKQSQDIKIGVDKNNEEDQGAGDQGLMFGYACNETDELMPLPIQMAHHLTSVLTEVRKTGDLDWLGPDGKSQVTIEYKNNKPVKVHKVVIATQHKDLLDKFDSELEEHKFITKEIINHVIIPVLLKYKIDYNEDFIVNGTGRFVVGGPVVDTGLTGRKIIVDTYGGYAKHGGGAFSGKDPSKVDRSAAYMARYIAKNIVAAKIADHCEVQLAYSIGIAEPVSLLVDTMGTGCIEDEKIQEIVKLIFSLKPEEIIKQLNLKTSFYQPLSSYGHFGREGYPWEKIDKIDEFKKYI